MKQEIFSALFVALALAGVFALVTVPIILFKILKAIRQPQENHKQVD